MHTERPKFQPDFDELAIVCDVGATKVATGVATTSEVFGAERHQTPRCDRDGLLQLLSSSILNLSDTYGTKTAVLAFNGPTKFVDGDCEVGPLYLITPDTFQLGAALEAIEPRLKGFQVLGLNDAEAAAYAAAQPPIITQPVRGEKIMYINLGTGVGGDTICNGQSTRGNGMLAEYGEQVLWLPDGRRVTWGDLVSGEAIQKLYGGETGCCAQTLFKDPSTDMMWDEVGRNIARGLMPLLSSVGPHKVVFGGSVSQCHQRFSEALDDELDKAFEAFSPDSGTKRAEIIYVPRKRLAQLALRGGYYGLQERRAELVVVGGHKAELSPILDKTA